MVVATIVAAGIGLGLASFIFSLKLLTVTIVSGTQENKMFAHLMIALIIMIVGRALFRNWESGAFAASAWAISREITQAEYRWIESFGNGLRANMPWWGGLDLRVWSKWDPWLDTLGPIFFSIAIVLVAKHFAKPSSTAAL